VHQPDAPAFLIPKGASVKDGVGLIPVGMQQVSAWFKNAGKSVA
jgi:hypothetical protein